MTFCRNVYNLTARMNRPLMTSLGAGASRAWLRGRVAIKRAREGVAFAWRLVLWELGGGKRLVIPGNGRTWFE